MPSFDDALDGVRDALTRQYGRPTHPAAGLDPFEALVTTVLDRALDARKRELAVNTLRDEGLLEPRTLAEADPAEVEDALRNARVVVTRGALAPLRKLANWLVERHQGSAEDLAGHDSPIATAEIRDELTAINGIGPSAADEVLLFALRRPVYPLDRATYRVLVRHGWIDPEGEAAEARDVVERLAANDPAALASVSLQFERLGKEFCRPTVAKCDRCPLRPFLPEGGPVDPTG